MSETENKYADLALELSQNEDVFFFVKELLKNDDALAFHAGLQSYEDGELVKKIMKDQKKVIKGVRETGKKGTLRIILDFRIKGVTGLMVEGDTGLTIPRNKKATHCYVDNECIPRSTHPGQKTFDTVQVPDELENFRSNKKKVLEA